MVLVMLFILCSVCFKLVSNLNHLMQGLPFWHDKALNVVKVVALYFSYRPTVEFFKDTIGLELTDTALCK